MRRRDLEDTIELAIWRTVENATLGEPHRAAKEIVAKLIAIGVLNVDEEMPIRDSK